MTETGINLAKGQKIELKKADGGALTAVFMGLGWDTASGGGIFGGGAIDLDASVVMLDAAKNKVDAVSFMQLVSHDGSIRHSGDNRTGAGDGDDEVIHVNLTTVPTNVETLVFVVNSYGGQTFDKVKNCFARLVDSVENKEVCIYKLDQAGTTNTGLVMAKVYRYNGAWKIAAIGAPCNGSTINTIMPDILANI
jgi:tellurium resistance protein TerZ